MKCTSEAELGNMSLRFVHMLPVVAGIAAFPLFSRSVATVAVCHVVVVVVNGTQSIVGFGHRFQQILQVLFVKQRTPLLQLALVSYKLYIPAIAVDLDSVLPDVVALIQVQGLGLAGRIVGIDIENTAGNFGQSDVELDVESDRGSCVHVNSFRQNGLEIVTHFFTDQVHDCCIVSK